MEISIGAGIAIAGVWLFPAITAWSSEVTGEGMFLATVCAMIMSLIILFL